MDQTRTFPWQLTPFSFPGVCRSLTEKRSHLFECRCPRLSQRGGSCREDWGRIQKGRKAAAAFEATLHMQLLYPGCPCGQRALGLHAEYCRQFRTALPSWCASALQVWSVWSRALTALVLHPCKRAVPVICDQLCLMWIFGISHTFVQPYHKTITEALLHLKVKMFYFSV